MGYIRLPSPSSQSMEEVNGLHNHYCLGVPKAGRIQMASIRGIPEAGKNQMRYITFALEYTLHCGCACSEVVELIN